MKKKSIFGLMMYRMVLLTIAVIVVAGFTYGVRQGILPGVSGNIPMLAQAKVKDRETAAVPSQANAKAPSVLNASSGDSKPAVKIKGTSAHSAAASPKKTSTVQGKTVYFTFDDGPSQLTDQVLNILKREHVNATFFVVGEHAKHSPELIQRIAAAGHALGNHTYNHEYDELYDRFDHFWNQIKETEEILRDITGYRTSLVRAPGGTFGHFDETYFKLLEEAGYQVFDWDIDSGDSKRKNVPSAEIVSNVTSARQSDRVVVLMHDGSGHSETVKALPAIIKFYKQKGYEFRTLSPEESSFHFRLDPAMKKTSRPAPSKAWVEANVAMNREVLGPGKPLIVEAGGVQTKLIPGEYELKDGQYLVPLRMTMQRLGAQVSWDSRSRNAVVTWGDARVTIAARSGSVASAPQGRSETEYSALFDRKNQSLWMPLRTLLEATGLQITALSTAGDERLVKAE